MISHPVVVAFEPSRCFPRADVLLSIESAAGVSCTGRGYACWF
jgi:hypothetical protein